MSEWNEKYLKQIVDIRVSNVDKKIYSNKALVKLCNYMDAYSNDYISNKISFSIGSADANEIKRFGLNIDDVIITKDSETPEDIAVSSVVIEELNNVVCGYHLAILRPDKNELDGKYLMFKLKSNDLKSYFSSVANGSTRFGLTIGNIENAKINFPTLAEQRQIARILSTADAVIEKTQSAIAKYKAIKQGMLHDLFTRGIDIATGKLRPKHEDAPELYKESKLGLIPKEWEEDIFSSKFDIINGGTPSTHIKEYWEGNIPWLSVEDFNNDKRYVSDAKKRITEEGLKSSSTNLLTEGMIIISARGTVGVITQLAKKMTFNQSCYGINTKSLKVSNDYCYYFLLHYKNLFGFNSFGSVFSTITRDYFDSMSISYPANQHEMNEIVNRISLMDSIIESEKSYLHKLQNIKAGLMDDLLSGKKQVICNRRC